MAKVGFSTILCDLQNLKKREFFICFTFDTFQWIYFGKFSFLWGEQILNSCCFCSKFFKVYSFYFLILIIKISMIQEKFFHGKFSLSTMQVATLSSSVLREDYDLIEYYDQIMTKHMTNRIFYYPCQVLARILPQDVYIMDVFIRSI